MRLLAFVAASEGERAAGSEVSPHAFASRRGRAHAVDRPAGERAQRGAAIDAMSESSDEARSPARDGSASESRVLLLAVLGFAALVLCMLGDLLFTSDEMRLPSHGQGDGARYFVYQRLFAYSELFAGNIPLWNPHTFSGAPHVGIFQSAVFYPPNLIYLLLSVRTGIVAEMSLHLLLMASFSFVWLRGKGLRPISCFVASVGVIFGATCSLRVLAGQLSVLDTFAWWPLLLLSIDRLAARASLGWTLTGVAAITMMILAGHPPTVLMAGAVTGLYCVPLLIGHPRLARFAGCLAAVAVAPLFLAAVQLWTGLHTASEGVRGGGMSFEFATSHSFPPEQLLTLLAPGCLR